MKKKVNWKTLKLSNIFMMIIAVLGGISISFFVVSISPKTMQWITSINPWYFFIIAIILITIVKLFILKQIILTLKKK